MHLDCKITLGHSDRHSLRDHDALNHRLRSACTCTQDPSRIGCPRTGHRPLPKSIISVQVCASAFRRSNSFESRACLHRSRCPGVATT